MARRADQTLGSLPGSESTSFQQDQDMMSTLKTHWVLILVILVLVYAAWHYGMKK
jgi:hypothetical protein